MGGRILVVDDDQGIRGLLRVYLERLGYAVETAEEGREALAKLALGSYEGVFLDFQMPGGLTGLEVLQHIHQSQPSLPVVMMTGSQLEERAAQVLAAGARACLFKPFQLHEVKHAAHRWFGTAA